MSGSRTPILALAAAVTFAAMAAAQPHTVTFVLDLRQEIAAGRFDPARDRVGVRGSILPLTWESTLVAADPDGDGRYEATATFPRAPFGGQAVAYKLKIDRPADPAAGWEDGRNRQLFLKEPAQTLSRAFDAPPEPVVTSRVGTIRVHPAFASRHVAARDVQVYLPPGYERERSRRYPVLYLHDGQNVFDAASAGMEWQVDETAERLIAAGRIAPVIVVAVAVGRRRDPPPAGGPAAQAGPADLGGHGHPGRRPRPPRRPPPARRPRPQGLEARPGLRVRRAGGRPARRDLLGLAGGGDAGVPLRAAGGAVARPVGGAGGRLPAPRWYAPGS